MSERLINPYACSICFKTFSVSLNLVKHVELKHLSPPIKPQIKIEPKDQDPEERHKNTDENKVIPTQYVDLMFRWQFFVQSSTCPAIYL